jgi:hypothetical protein
VAIDFSEPTFARGRTGAAHTRVSVIVNGIFNWNPARVAIFGELGRVVRPGGFVYSAELILGAAVRPTPHTESDRFA